MTSLPTVVYSIPDEGLGHAVRSSAMIRELSKYYSVHIYTSGNAFNYFRDKQACQVHELKDNIRFVRDDTKVKYFDSGCEAIEKLYFTPRTQLELEVRSLNPVAVITDFEPILARIARSLNVPLISVDNQHKFSATYFPHGFGFKNKAYIVATSFFVDSFIPAPALKVVSTFHYDLLMPAHDTKLVNIFLREELKSIERTEGEHILVYCKDVIQDKLLKVLSQLEHPCIIYGATKPVNKPNLTYKKMDDTQFLHDLASCKKVICTAGNQLPGEARYLEKAVLVIPEPAQYEQSINAVCAVKLHMGWQCEIDDLSKEYVENFLKNSYPTPERGADNAVQEAAKSVVEFIESRRRTRSNTI